MLPAKHDSREGRGQFSDARRTADRRGRRSLGWAFLLVLFALPGSAADAPGTAAEDPAPGDRAANPLAPGPRPTPIASAQPVDEQTQAEARRNAALERLIRGDPGVPEVPYEDTLPRNREARLIHVVPPEYPEELVGSGLSAEVMLSVMVDREGKASHVRVEDSAHPLFTNAALDAVYQWEFLPRIREGRITNARMRLTVLVSEEVGDRAVHDYPGGRIALEDLTYETEPDTPLRRFFGLRPAYPFAMLAEGKAGEVVLEFNVGEEGIPRDIKVIEATNRDFAYACQGALVHWQFTPAMKRGRAVSARLRYRMSFEPEEFDEKLLELARGLYHGRPTGLMSSRTVSEQPRVLRQFNPSSYDGTRNAPRRRRVTVEVVVTELGEVLLPRVVSSPDPLSGYIALAAVSYWRFEPARKDGQPVAVNVTLPVTF